MSTGQVYISDDCRCEGEQSDDREQEINKLGAMSCRKCCLYLLNIIIVDTSQSKAHIVL